MTRLVVHTTVYDGHLLNRSKRHLFRCVMLPIHICMSKCHILENIDPQTNKLNQFNKQTSKRKNEKKTLNKTSKIKNTYLIKYSNVLTTQREKERERVKMS